MFNKEIAQQFSLLSKLMDIHGENSFRSKNYSIAAYRIEKLPEELSTLSQIDIFKLQGIGETIGKKIVEILETGKMDTLTSLIAKTPAGVLEMMNIKGIGPKKIAQIWKEMEIETVGELLYACHENRLSNYKGFGKKTQENVIESIEFYLRQQGNYLYAQVEKLAEDFCLFFEQIFNVNNVLLTGDMRRHSETIDTLEFIVATPLNTIKNELLNRTEYLFLLESDTHIEYQYKEGIKIKIHSVTKDEIIKTLFETTGSETFMASFKQYFPTVDYTNSISEEAIFSHADIQIIPPYLRETANIIELAKTHSIPSVIQSNDIKGIIHCHSNWSDGVSTIEELANACIQKGYEYLVLSDHSKSAAYAQGLTEERIRQQHILIDEINNKIKPFKIFKSIESDILNDGNLDYSDSLLSTFDLVIASVHSNLKMTEEKAMMRLIKAIENPYTTILGHMTGRLLLSRPGYPVDYKKIIDACAANKVVIEINAHPRRLDMRWQWLEYALSKNVLVSINPDAHSIPEFDNTRYGVLVAQKGMVTSKENLSSFSLNEFEDFLTNRK